MTIKNGDLPVSPVTVDKLHGSTCSNGYWDRISMGLTKREHFAALAMQGLLVNMGQNGLDSIKQVVEHAVCAADTLLAELERTK